MTALASCCYLAVCAWLAMRVTGSIGAAGAGEPLFRVLVFAVLFFAVFFLGFHVAGFVSLATGWALVTVPYALCVPVALAGADLALGRGTGRGVQLAGRPAAPGLLPAATALSFGLVAVMLAFGFPQGYEVLAYHLPGAVQILQSHSLQAWDGNFPHTFPANASIWFAFFLGFLPEKLVSAANLVFLAPLVLGTVAISRRIGADTRASLLAACGLATVPMIAFSAVELGADVGGLAFLALAIYFALTRAASPDAAAVLAGLGAGLAFGFKSLHLISMGLLALVIVARAFEGRPRVLAGAAAGFRRGGLFLLAAGLTAGFWLVRNRIDFGNPFYPVNLPILGDLMGWSKAADVDFSQRHATQFEWVRSSAEWLVYPWLEWQDNGQNFKHSSGLGAFIAATVPVSLAAVAAAIAKDGVRRHRARCILLAAVAFIIATWWVLDDRQPRYALAALPYCIPLVAWVITQAGPRSRRTMDCTAGLCVAAMLAVFVSKEALLFGDRIIVSRYSTRPLFYEYPPGIDALPAGATILNLADRAWHYPLAGAGLANRVVSMPEGRRILGLAPGLTAPREVSLRAAPLKALGVTHLFVTGGKVLPGPCVRLREVARLTRNPANGVALDQPRLLFAVSYVAPADHAACAQDGAPPR